MQTAFVGFGGNLGDVAATFDKALARLLADGGIRFRESSHVYRTPPWGGIAQPDYLNAVVRLDTTLTPQDLLTRMLAVEAAFGRQRAQEIRWGARTLDLDLLLYGDLRIDDESLQVPHPRFKERAFVVVPMAEIAPDRVLFDGSVLRDIASAHAGAIMTVLDRRIQPERQNETDSTT